MVKFNEWSKHARVNKEEDSGNCSIAYIFTGLSEDCVTLLVYQKMSFVAVCTSD